MARPLVPDPPLDRSATIPATPRRIGRVGTAIILIFAMIVVASAARLALAPLPSGRSLTWQVAFGFRGIGVDPTSVRAATVVRIEVERPACAPSGSSWLATPIVTSTPVAVFITIRMADNFNVPGCTGTLGYRDGRLPTVGNYLTGTYLDVNLPEPLNGRALFDGSGLLPELRDYSMFGLLD